MLLLIRLGLDGALPASDDAGVFGEGARNVIPAKAVPRNAGLPKNWVPAFAGTTDAKRASPQILLFFPSSTAFPDRLSFLHKSGQSFDRVLS